MRSTRRLVLRLNALLIAEAIGSNLLKIKVSISKSLEKSVQEIRTS